MRTRRILPLVGLTLVVGAAGALALYGSARHLGSEAEPMAEDRKGQRAAKSKAGELAPVDSPPATAATAEARAESGGRYGLRGPGKTGPASGQLGKKHAADGDVRFDDVPVVADSKASPDMTFQHYGVNPTIETRQQPLSTFAVDVDTTGYTMARAYLDRGSLPDEAAVRVEEFVNAFDYGYAPPTEGAFSVQAEAYPSPNRKGYHVLHVGLKGRVIDASARKPANLVFVVDISGSMDMENRLGLVKRSLRLLVDELREDDTVAVVVYGSEARMALPPTSAHQKQRILTTIDALHTEGATNAEAGLRLGYQVAARQFRGTSINRVILCSDGVANVGITGAGGILEVVERERARGITISTVGFGMGNYNDVLLEQLADKGNGNYYYVDQLDEARRVFVENLTGTLQVIAKDVKIQVDFDPRSVARYRLIGYENRALEARDFSNDRVDAGEIGSGHSVTAIYEVKLLGDATDLGKIRIRYKAPTGAESELIERTLSSSIVRSTFEQAAPASQLSYLAAAFGEKLRGSYWVRNVAYEDLTTRFDRLPPALREQARVAELGRLIRTAERLDRRGDKFEREMPVAMMDFDHVPVLR